ncbi:MAG: hypothetical protein DRH57_07810 [Candidatus Cloacimonadota bacterium]|nr:MAG: hypothetical protein DRH57_07810 [Candidatus Cloacimonadota bacterium]
MWFNNLTDFKEESHKQVQSNITIEDGVMTSLVNGKSYSCGRLEIPTLGELREQYSALNIPKEKLKISEVIGDIKAFYNDKANAGAMFQVASQFNLLEMVNPYRTPEEGVDIYEYDATQGPASAMSCGAGTIYRNYFVNVNSRIGQTSDNQVDCLKDIGDALGNTNNKLWEMSNGYTLLSEEGLKEINKTLINMNIEQYNALKSKLRVGIQWNTEVTLNNRKDIVNQVYCSALPVTYLRIEDSLWEKFARLILEATYEATFYAALINYQKTGNNKLFLTLVGGGAFGNKMEWIINAIMNSLNKFRNTPLDVRVVSYGGSKWEVSELVSPVN